MDKREKHKEWCRSHYQRNKGYYLKRNQKRRKEIREFVLALRKSLSCERCGFNSCHAALDFHHPGGKPDFRIAEAAQRNFSIERIKTEVAKCVVLCATCHRVEHCKENHAPLV